MIKVRADFVGFDHYKKADGSEVELYKFSIYPLYDVITLTKRNLNGFDPVLGSHYVIDLNAFHYTDADENTRASIGGKVISFIS